MHAGGGKNVKHQKTKKKFKKQHSFLEGYGEGKGSRLLLPRDSIMGGGERKKDR